jgi:Uma2 family endonuclease
LPTLGIRLSPRPGYATENDVIALHDRENRLFELVDGVLVEKAMGFYEARLAAFLIEILGSFARRRDLGVVVGPDGMMRLAPGLVRMPDVSFISWPRLPEGIDSETPMCVSPFVAVASTREQVGRTGCNRIDVRNIPTRTHTA